MRRLDLSKVASEYLGWMDLVLAKSHIYIFSDVFLIVITPSPETNKQRNKSPQTLVNRKSQISFCNASLTQIYPFIQLLQCTKCALGDMYCPRKCLTTVDLC